MAAADPQRVLVTGGSGFLGGWCVIELLRAGHLVRTTVRDLSREPGVREAIASQVEEEAQGRLEFAAADLTADEGWDAAVRDRDAVLHVASPFPSSQPKDPDELIVPAREGTLRVLRAALEAGARRVVVTSSVAAVGGGSKPGDSPIDESSWTETTAAGVTPYAQSKTLAERAAWDFVRERGALERLAVVNPGAILGPALDDDHSFSLQLVTRLLGGTPGIPRIGFSLVDVRDVAALQILAMNATAAGGERFIAVSRFAWMEEVARILREGLGAEAAKVPTRRVPDLLVRAMALFDPGVRSFVHQLGKETTYSSEKARSLLGWEPRPIEETVVDCGRSLA